jgi:hypothetical protein
MADIGVAAQPSLEDCITALKKMIDDQMQLDKDTLFPQFTISDQVEQEVPLQVWTAIEIYQNEVKIPHNYSLNLNYMSSLNPPLTTGCFHR